jgi:hypothetical protein
VTLDEGLSSFSKSWMSTLMSTLQSFHLARATTGCSARVACPVRLIGITNSRRTSTRSVKYCGQDIVSAKSYGPEQLLFSITVARRRLPVKEMNAEGFRM